MLKNLGMTAEKNYSHLAAEIQNTSPTETRGPRDFQESETPD
jgi:hypothetical protein